MSSVPIEPSSSALTPPVQGSEPQKGIMQKLNNLPPSLKVIGGMGVIGLSIPVVVVLSPILLAMGVSGLAFAAMGGAGVGLGQSYRLAKAATCKMATKISKGLDKVAQNSILKSQKNKLKKEAKVANKEALKEMKRAPQGTPLDRKFDKFESFANNFSSNHQIREKYLSPDELKKYDEIVNVRLKLEKFISKPGDSSSEWQNLPENEGQESELVDVPLQNPRELQKELEDGMFVKGSPKADDVTDLKNFHTLIEKRMQAETYGDAIIAKLKNLPTNATTGEFKLLPKEKKMIESLSDLIVEQKDNKKMVFKLKDPSKMTLIDLPKLKKVHDEFVGPPVTKTPQGVNLESIDLPPAENAPGSP